MNESLILRFASSGRQLNVVEFQPSLGLVFDTHPDASPLNVVLGLQPRLPQLLDPVRRRHDWRDREFMLDVRRDGAGIRLSGAGGDPKGLPAGIYDLTVEVESYDFENFSQTVEIPADGQAEVTLHEKADPRLVKLRNSIDPVTAAILDNSRSTLDGQTVRQWLGGAGPRECRKACLLNILAKLRVPPAPAAGLPAPLSGLVEFVYFADVDRVYAAVQPDLNDILSRLTDAKLWVKEGRPKAKIHERLLDSLERLKVDTADGKFTLASFRQGGRNCLQIVVATPRKGFSDPTLYADIDIDLGNPLWDLEGVFVHLGELLDSGKTSHFALHDKLDKGETKDFLYYDLVRAEKVPV